MSTQPARAIVQSGYGEPKDVLSFSSSAPLPPPPTSTHLQLRVYAASINPIDNGLVHGRLRLFWPLSFPHTPGLDVSGVVTAVGPAVTRFRVGDSVCGDGSSFGAFADVCDVDEQHVALKPQRMSHVEAACLGVAGQSALVALERGQLSAGQKVVVIGASGGVGHYAIQMAAAMGASSVVGVCSARNADFVRSLGATSTIDYNAQPISAALQKEYDVVIDCAGGPQQWDEATKIMKPGGRFVTIAASRGSMLGSAWAYVRRTIGSHFGERHSYQSFFLRPTAAQIDRVAQFARDGKLKTSVEKTFELSLSGVTDMYSHIEGGRTRGKLALKVRDEA